MILPTTSAVTFPNNLFSLSKKIFTSITEEPQLDMGIRLILQKLKNKSPVLGSIIFLVSGIAIDLKGRKKVVR
jgi:hypothetical protein